MRLEQRAVVMIAIAGWLAGTAAQASERHFTCNDEKWSLWMNKMRRKAKLNDDQYRQLASYVETLRPKTK